MTDAIIVGLSGGVDSAVAAAILVDRGYQVEGLFMKNWEEDSKYCTSEQDYKDALQVCSHLGIPLRSINFSKEYWEKVFEYFLNEYKIGRTPNPDILCNTEIKFKAFLDYSLDLGANKIATGHYAINLFEDGSQKLIKGKDIFKEQSYFLYGLNQKQLSYSIFPLGDWKKSEVRKKAVEYGFLNHNKKDSTGICFIGERHFKDFLKQYIPSQPGEITTTDGLVVGQHEGSMFYTIGQRQGLGIGGIKGSKELPWYVIDKISEKNRIVVAQGKDNSRLYHKYLKCSKIHWISGKAPESKNNLKAKVRYRGNDSTCKIKIENPKSLTVIFKDPQFAIAPGQSIVFYNDKLCLGGAIIDSRWN
ncbi:MAG: tRNA 2-thiouridine(34) synthase MnmA [Candidatus Marinimicrobia bacterium]|nr:tRNA 2-thiouridine(34) synthase MnmA [Candidatus Neomarinimicrobiota bacterium]